MHVHDLVPFQTSEFDVSHKIEKLSFGQEYPGMKNPLDGVDVPRVNPHNPSGATGMYQYFLKARPPPPSPKSHQRILCLPREEMRRIQPPS